MKNYEAYRQAVAGGGYGYSFFNADGPFSATPDEIQRLVNLVEVSGVTKRGRTSREVAQTVMTIAGQHLSEGYRAHISRRKPRGLEYAYSAAAGYGEELTRSKKVDALVMTFKRIMDGEYKKGIIKNLGAELEQMGGSADEIEKARELLHAYQDFEEVAALDIEGARMNADAEEFSKRLENMISRRTLAA